MAGPARAGQNGLLHSTNDPAELTMPDYSAPLQQMRFTIEHLADFKNVAAPQA